MSKREPPRGLLAIGMAGLVLEALVLVLAAPAVAAAERGHVVAWHLAYLLSLAAALAAAGAVLRRLRRPLPGTVVQPFVVAAGVITWPLYPVGLIFAGIWVYYLRLWRPPDAQT